MKGLLKWWKARRLRQANEKYAYWKAKHGALKAAISEKPRSEFDKIFGGSFFGNEQADSDRKKVAEAAANEAKYMERVEAFMREN